MKTTDMSITHNIQTEVAKATEARGYREGWSDVQFLARQIAKLQEELTELAFYVRDDNSAIEETNLEWRMIAAANAARAVFHGVWFSFAGLRHENQETFDGLRLEAADCQVVLYNIAATIERITGEKFDLSQAALEKAIIDIPRWARK